MKVIKPNLMTSAMLASTTATEAYAEWSAATAYALNDRVTLAATQRVYGCVQGPSTNNAPASSPLYWANLGPSNTWAMFDDKISTASGATNALTVSIDTGYINSLALLGLVGASAAIRMTNGAGGPEVYNRTVSLDGTIIADWYQYFFEPSVSLGSLWLTDLPPYINARITVTVTAVGPVAVGMLTFGTFYELGAAQLGASAGLISYAKKNTDSVGVTTFTPGANAKRMSISLTVPKGQINKVHGVLTGLDGVPCMWIGVDDAALSPLAIYGFFRDFGLVVQYQTESLYSLEIEGLI
jgi:hypothetical protein